MVQEDLGRPGRVELFLVVTDQLAHQFQTRVLEGTHLPEDLLLPLGEHRLRLTRG